MFTGIVTAVGVVESVEDRAQCRRIVINTDMDLGDGELGESIAINGCCLTVVEFVSGGFAVDVAQESLKVTTLGGLQAGARVNLERALRLSDRLGGHWVQGHVDGIGTLVDKETQAEGELWEVTFPPELAKYLVKKGSITIDGVSLTLNKKGIVPVNRSISF